MYVQILKNSPKVESSKRTRCSLCVCICALYMCIFNRCEVHVDGGSAVKKMKVCLP